MFFFFFQAEDGIRDDLVTGVQTCALPILARALDGQTERGHVLQRLAKKTVEFFVACLNLGHHLQPPRHRLGMARLVARPNTMARRVEELLSILEFVEQASVPSLHWLKGDLKTEPPIGENGVARCARNQSGHGTTKIPV